MDYSCEYLSILVSSKIYADKFSKVSLNVIISFGYILCFQSVTIFLYVTKEIIANITASGYG